MTLVASFILKIDWIRIWHFGLQPQMLDFHTMCNITSSRECNSKPDLAWFTHFSYCSPIHGWDLTNRSVEEVLLNILKIHLSKQWQLMNSRTWSWSENLKVLFEKQKGDNSASHSRLSVSCECSGAEADSSSQVVGDKAARKKLAGKKGQGQAQ